MEPRVYLILGVLLAIVPPWVMKYDRKKWVRKPTVSYLWTSLMFLSVIGNRLKNLDFLTTIGIGGVLGIITLLILYWKNKGNTSSSEIIVDEIVQALSFFILLPSLGLG